MSVTPIQQGTHNCPLPDPHDNVIDTTLYSSPRPEGMCQRCGAMMVGEDDGTWRVV